MHTIPELASPQSWKSTLPSRSAEIAQAILEGLPRGFEFAKPFVSTEPAEGAAWEVPCFYDTQHETTLTLVLGGDFTYRAKAQRLDKLRDSIPAEDWSLIASDPCCEGGGSRACARVSDGPLSHVRVGD